MEQFLADNQWVLLAITAWVLPWKGVALWRAAKSSQRKWFVAMLVINTLAILEILYIFFYSQKKNRENPGNGI